MILFKGFMRSCLSFLKSDDNLYRSVLAGILSLGQNGIFSALNNVIFDTVYSSSGFQQDFGFTEQEVKELMKAANIPDEMFSRVKFWFVFVLIILCLKKNKTNIVF